MSDFTITALSLGLLFSALPAALCYVSYRVGEQAGRDLQRVADIQEQWARDEQRRDPKSGRFRKCSLTCTRNECGDTSEVKQ